MTSNDNKPVNVRQRRIHTRSRTGCAECRARRVKCDEYRPTCQNCTRANKVCEYPPAKIPLRERRALERAGTAQPWAPIPWDASISSRQPEVPNTQRLTHQLILSGSKKNLDCLAINMPLKSHELFHYFYQPEGSAGVSPSDYHKRRMAHIISDPDALRSAVLIAATHFGFNYGNIRKFEQAFYFHTLETVRLVKEWFAKGDFTLCAPITKQMALLAYTEVCRGDHQMAEKHLNAIYALSRHREKHLTTGATILDQELSDRYFLITSTFMHGTTTALEFIRRPAGLTETTTSSVSTNSTPRMSSWHITDDRGHYFHIVTLNAIREFPVTLNYSGDIFQDVSVVRVMKGLRILTRNFYDGHSKSSPRSTRQIQREFWQSEAAAMLYDGLIQAHKSAVSEGHKRQANADDKNEQKTSWVGLVIAIELYLEQVVVLWQPFTRENYLHTMRILQRHLGYALQKPDASHLADLLFWESFVAVISLQVHERHGDLAQDPGIKPYFEEFAREQSRVLGLKTWEDVQAALLRVVWPCDFTDDDYVKGIWEAVMKD
ncbi:hypothetical protein FPOAC2_07553 [Fusarium poae]|uniref:hypothetical protein n=1 Tax=Fusarium poae TaxID=36050 RepID=UPI001CE747FC|nr:hypothetical protein FPOAC1_007641 [Fusarium poae]KAG8668263.1 hypothetical protein FPOAC1_007641 [Fusarium poae]